MPNLGRRDLISKILHDFDYEKLDTPSGKITLAHDDNGWFVYLKPTKVIAYFWFTNLDNQGFLQDHKVRIDFYPNGQYMINCPAPAVALAHKLAKEIETAFLCRFRLQRLRRVA